MEEQYSDIFDDIWEACQDSDAIIASPTASNARECAETLAIPLAFGLLQPLIPTREFPSFFLPPWPALGGTFNNVSHHLFNQLLWQNVRSNVNRWRRDRLGLGSASLLGPYSWMQNEKVLQLVACSPSLISKPSDWREWHHLTGYWFLRHGGEFEPPSRVESFLASGSPPVYVGFGSMDDEQPERLTQLVVEALESSNQRGILATGWGGLQRGELPDGILQVDEISHHWLFPRVAAIVHHGGAGTTASALYSGIPSVSVPFGGDQHHWGRLLVERGLSPVVLPVKGLNSSALADAISKLVTDQDLRLRASSFGETIRAEQGISRAIDVIGAHWR